MYIVRASTSVLIKLLPSILRAKRFSLRSLLEPFQRSESFRFGAMFGSFTFLWRLLNDSLYHIRRKHDRWNGFASGAVAGLSILIEKKEMRVVVSQQLFMRGMQAQLSID